MRNNVIFCLSCLVVLAFGIKGVFAADSGPCVKFVSASSTNTGYCNFGVCLGNVVNILPQSLCAGKDESPCKQSSQPYKVTYNLKAAGGILGCIGVSCEQDLSTRTESGTGATCGAR